MRRKLIGQGRGGLTLCLPKKWAHAKQLAAGDEVEVIDASGKLLISAESLPLKKEGTVACTTNDERFLQYILNNYYRSGYTHVHLNNPPGKKQMYTHLKLLEGFDVVEDIGKTLTIECLSESSVDKKDYILRQIFFTVSQDMKEVIEQLQQQKKCDHEKLTLQSEWCIKRTNVFLRIASRESGDSSKFSWTLLNLITWIERELFYLSEEISHLSMETLTPAQVRYLVAIQESFDALHQGIYTKDTAALEKVHTMYKEYELKKFDLMKNQSKYRCIILHHFNMIHRFVMRSTSSAIGLIVQA